MAHEVSRNEVLSWLTELNFSATYESCLNDWQEGTGQWFFETTEFQQWLRGDKKTLWCQGHAGAGKTIMMSVVIHHFQQIKSAKEAVIYAYLNHSDAKGTESTALITSFISQLAEQAPHLSKQLLDSYKKHKDSPTSLLRRESKDLLSSEANRFERLHIIIDGLDERRDEAVFALLSSVNELLNSHPAAFLIASSRKIDSICSYLKDPVVFDLEARRSDIDKYIDGSLRDDLPVLKRRVEQYRGLSDLIKTKLNEKAKGMFLLPKLHLQILEKSKGRNRKAYEDLLNDLPTPLDQTYKLLWDRIQSQNDEDVELATTVMTWLCCCQETLSIEAFGYALISSIENHSQLRKDDLIDEEQLVDVCLGLVVIDRVKEIVGFSHYTAEDYFKKNFPTPSSHRNIASACMQYLSVIPLRHRSRVVAADIADQLLNFPFFSYASRNWGFHVRNAGDDSMLPLVLQFLSLSDRTTASGRVLSFSHDQSFLDEPRTILPDQISGIHLAAFFGLMSIIERIPDSDWSINVTDTRGWSVLRWACFGRQTEIVELLLKWGADADLRDVIGDTTLMWALGRRRTRCVFKGISIRNSVKHFGHTVYVRAQDNINLTLPEEPQPFNCSRKTIKDLIQYSHDLNARGYRGRTALSYAAENQQFQVVSWLLDRGVDIDGEDDNGMTPLLWSLQAPFWTCQFVDCTFENSIILIGDLIFVDLMETESETDTLFRKLPPRDLAQENMALQLIGKYVNAIDFSGSTALKLAIERGYLKLVNKLLELHANPNFARSLSEHFCRANLTVSGCTITKRSSIMIGAYVQIHWSEEKGLKRVGLSELFKSVTLIYDVINNTYMTNAVSESMDRHDSNNPKSKWLLRLYCKQDIKDFSDAIRPQIMNYLGDTNVYDSSVNVGTTSVLTEDPINSQDLPGLHSIVGPTNPLGRLR